MCTVNTPFSYPANVPEAWSVDKHRWLCITEADELVLLAEDDNVFADGDVVYYVQVSAGVSIA